MKRTRHFWRVWRSGVMSLGALLLVVASFPARAGEVLTGTTRLACEAILCLSSGVRPGECAPALNHYFGILVYGKYGLDWPATVAARHAFLSLCPVVSSPGMPELVDAIASGAGRCDAATLNSRLRRPAYKFRERWLGGDAGSVVEIKEFQAISDEKPLYCLVYERNQYTFDVDTKYVGDPFRGGRWVDAKDYSRAVQEWQANYGSQSDEGYTYSWTHPAGDSGTYGGN